MSPSDVEIGYRKKKFLNDG